MWIAGFGFAAFAAAFAAIPAGQVDGLYAAALLLVYTSSSCRLLRSQTRQSSLRSARISAPGNMWAAAFARFAALAAALAVNAIVTEIPGDALRKSCRRLKEWSNSFDIAMTEEKVLLWSLNALRRLQCYSGTDFSGAEHGIKEGKAKTPAAWVAATAAPHHVTGNRNLLSGFIIEHDDQFVHAVDGVPRKVLARGAVITDSMVLPDVWFVPGLSDNLVSVSQLVELDHSVSFSCGECCIRGPDGKVVGNGHLQEGGHYALDFLKVPLAI